MLDECDLTPMLSAKQRSSVSWFVSPSSLASSWTRILPGKACPFQDRPARSRVPGAFPEAGHALRSLPISSGSTSARRARPKALRRLADSKQAMSAHNQAPRPGPGPTTSAPLGSMLTRRNSAAGRRERQPMQVRTGFRGVSASPLGRPGSITAHDAGTDRAQAVSGCCARGSASPASEPSARSCAMAAVHASALIASPPSAGCHRCSPVSGSVIHSPSAHSTSP